MRIILFSGLLTAAWILGISCKKETHADPGFSALNLSQNIYSVTAHNGPAAGEILVAPFKIEVPDSGHLMKLDQDGQLTWEKYLPASAADFKRWTVNGKTRYSYFVHNVSAYQLGILGSLSGYEAITDENMNEIKEVNLLPFNDIKTDQQQSLDGHDFIYLGDDHYITMAYYNKSTAHVPAYYNPSPTGIIVAPIIQEIKDNQVIWQWDASLDSSFYGASVISHHYDDGSTPQDYLHLNSMFIDPRDNNLICSFRNSCQIVKLKRGTNQVLWRLGGPNSDFALRADQQFLFQHDATLTDGDSTLLLFDNGDETARPATRILEMKIDETLKTISFFKAYDLADEGYSNIMGSVQKFGTTYFIGGGNGNYFTELNSTTGTKYFEMRSKYTTYRAFKYYK